MKLKCTPDDFCVTELTDRRSTDGGFCFYQLNKSGIGTLEALQMFQRSRNIAASQVSHGGLKDRHAVTSQFLTVRNGPRADYEDELFCLRYLGQTSTAYGAADIVGNRFEIVIRSLANEFCDRISDHVQSIAEHGFPNYFDEQRFGSLGASGEFIAEKWCKKDYERALWLALADHNHHDNGAERKQKEVLRNLWGRWSECKQQLDRSHRRSIVTYLVDHPEGFRKAFALLNQNLRGLYLSAFQSAVWNRMLAAVYSEAQVEQEESRTLTIGDAELPFPIERPDRSELPLPSARCKGLSADMREICDRALQPYEMTLNQMKLSFPRDRWFSRGQRSTTVQPREVSADPAVDEIYSGKQKLTLKFDLPRGSYATMMIKAVTGGQA